MKKTFENVNFGRDFGNSIKWTRRRSPKIADLQHVEWETIHQRHIAIHERLYVDWVVGPYNKDKINHSIHLCVYSQKMDVAIDPILQCFLVKSLLTVTDRT